jgi:hypothetical protein
MGGKSSADASTKSTTIDQRAVTESGVALTASERAKLNFNQNQTDTGVIVTAGAKSNVAVQTSDMGAITEAFGFARSVARDAFDMSAASQVDTSRTITDAMNKVEDAFSEAYVGAKQGEQKVLAVVGMGVVAMIAMQALKGK